MKKYRAFISYSHREDKELGARLQYGLQQFARPWYKIRSVNVFRDDADLNLSPDLWKSITNALDDSEYFLLLSNPTVTESYWVGKEIEYWLANHDPSKLILILTGGDILWNHSVGDFNWEKTNALHPKLNGFFKNDPFFLDLRWAKTVNDRSLQNPDFKKAIASVSATIRNMAVEDLLGEEVEQLKRTHRIRNGVIASLSVLLFCAVFLGLRAYWEQQKAIANAYVAESVLELEQRKDPVRSYVLAKKAYELEPTLAARSAILASQLSKGYLDNDQYYVTPFYKIIKQGKKEIRGLSISPSNETIAICSDNMLYWGKTGEALNDSMRIPISPIYDIKVGDNGSWIFCAGKGNELVFVNTKDKSIKRIILKQSLQVVYRLALSNDGKQLAAATDEGKVMLIDIEKLSIADTIKAQQQLVTTLYYAPDGRLITASSDNTIALWKKNEIGKMELERIFPTNSRVNEIRMLPGHNHLLLAKYNKTLEIVSMDGSSVYDTLAHSNSITSIDLSPDGNYAISASSDLKMHLYKIQINENSIGLTYLTSFEGHKNWVNKVCYSKEGDNIFSVSRDGSLRSWTNKASKGARVSRFPYRINEIRWTTHGEAILATMGGIYRWNGASIVDSLLVGEPVWHIDFHEKTNRLVYCDVDFKIFVLDMNTKKKLLISPSEGEDENDLTRIRCVAFYPDGNRIAFGDLSRHLKVKNLKGEFLYREYINKEVTSISFHNQTGNMYVSYSDLYSNGVRVMDDSYKTVLELDQVHEEAIISLKNDERDATVMLSSSCDGSARVWTKDMKQLLSLEGHGRFVYDITTAQLNGEKYYITSSWDGFDRIWSEQGNELALLRLHGKEQGFSIKVMKNQDRWVTISPYHIIEWNMNTYY